MAEPLEATLRRLKEERQEADRRYNDALTALDRANPGAFRPPAPVRAVDEHQLAALNEAWKTLQEPPPGGLKGRLAGLYVSVRRSCAGPLPRKRHATDLALEGAPGSDEGRRPATRAAGAAPGGRLRRTHVSTDAVDAQP